MRYTLIQPPKLKGKEKTYHSENIGKSKRTQCTGAFIRKQLLEIYGWFGIGVLYRGRYIEAHQQVNMRSFIAYSLCV
jgi:hypothetical protein